MTPVRDGNGSIQEQNLKSNLTNRTSGQNAVLEAVVSTRNVQDLSRER